MARENKDLESRLESKSLVKNEIKEYLVDTSASLLYGNTVFGLGEYFIAGLSSDELLKTRISMSILGLFIYRPYGKFREYWSWLWNANKESSPVKKYLTDVCGSIVFFAPIYSSVLYASGGSREKILSALGAGIVISTITSRPSGWFLDKWRKLWGTKPTLD